MYCSTCASAVSPNLTYCNHCGAKLSGAKGDNITKNLLFFMTANFVFGLVAIIFLMMAMRMVFGPENIGLIIFFMLISFLIMLVVEGVFIWMLLGRKKGAKEAAKELNEAEAEARMLPEPAMSVTEHTTRNLETVDRNRQTG